MPNDNQELLLKQKETEEQKPEESWENMENPLSLGSFGVKEILEMAKNPF